jgi:hypothetical protein
MNSTTAPVPSTVVPSAVGPCGARRLLAIGAAVSTAAFLVAVTGLIVDPTQITGAPAWMKPAKFAFSITIYLLTLRVILSFVRGHARLLSVIAAVIVTSLVAEIVLIDLQVLRGTTSHFNDSTGFDATILFTMAGIISVVLFATILAAVLVLRVRGLDAGIAAGLRWGIGVCVLGMLVAITMITNTGWSDSGGHTVGAPDGEVGMPVTGWSLMHGDLRVGHFVGVHALQALPLLAWALARWTRQDARTRARLLHVAGGGYVAVVLLLTWQALRAQSILRPDGETLLAAAALAAVIALAAAIVVVRRVHR